jgi:hypothetical protein
LIQPEKPGLWKANFSAEARLDIPMFTRVTISIKEKEEIHGLLISLSPGESKRYETKQNRRCWFTDLGWGCISEMNQS